MQRSDSLVTTEQSFDGEIHAGGVRILHVEDHYIVARVAKEMLELEWWEVETCSDGVAALERICGQTPYDLLLLDYDLPGVHGLELVSWARRLAHRARTPIVVLSAIPVGQQPGKPVRMCFYKSLKVWPRSLKQSIAY